MDTNPNAPSEPPLAVVVLGHDEAGRPHASTFTPEEAALATRAASLMAFKVLPVTEAVAPLAAKLPKGRLFSSGKGFVPFVKAETFEALAKCGGLVTPTPPDPSELPSPKPKRGKKAAAEAPLEPVRRPATWEDVQVGDLVLASEGVAKGWWEVEVLEDRGDDQFVVRWWDWPDEAPFPRRRDQLALTPPTLVETV